MDEELNSPQLHLFDKAVTIVVDKQRYQQQLTQQITITLSPQSPSQSCLKKLFCLTCLKTQRQHKQSQKKYNKTKSIKAILTNRQQNQTLFCIRLLQQQDHGKQFIGSWYDVLIFSEWENQQTQDQVLSSKGIEIDDNTSSQTYQWYSKIIIWFSSYQFTLVFYDRKQHEHLFSLFITLKQYYTKFHPQSQYNSLILRHYVEYKGNDTNQLTKNEITQLIKGMNFKQKDFMKHLNQVQDYNLKQNLSRDGFMKLIQVMQCPQDLFKIYQRFARSYAKNNTKYEMYAQQCMTQKEFKKFMKQVQHQESKRRTTSISFQGQNVWKSQSHNKNSQKLLSQHNLSSNLSFITFCRHILSLSKNPAIEPQQINSKYPLASYYINSSHNTYLVGNQLTSMSSANIYYLNLLQGMRCVQLDIHDSPHGPIIKHGYTMTAEITFDDAIKAIMKFCYQNPQHTPIILSFQNHCTQKNRRQMAKVLSKIPKEKFYSIPQSGNNLQQFPTLAQLKGKIIIQGTGKFEQLYPKIKMQQKKFQTSTKDQLKPQDIMNIIGQKQNFFRFVFDNNKQDSKRQAFEDKTKQLQNMKYLFEQKVKDLVGKISSKYSSKKDQYLLQYYGMVASPFNLQNSCWQMANIAENNIIKMINGQISPTPQDIYKYSSHSLIRIYPFGLRFNSSNFNTIPMLQCGCQLVSLNTQNVDVYYVMMQGLFEKNRNCGYAKKKDFKRQDQKQYKVRIVFMDSLDLRPRRVQNISSMTSLQVSFVGSQQDMKQNCKYVNYRNSSDYIQQNQPVTISYSIPCKTLQSRFVGMDKFELNDPPQILQNISETKYPHVELSIKSIDFAHLYVNLMHCGSISLSLADIREGLRIVPIYCYEIGRKKRMGNLLVWLQIDIKQ